LYHDYLPSAQSTCPKTIALLKQCPEIKAAMFAMLPSGSQLMKHRDPFAGSLRYHLGLITPNSDLCRIIVDGESYFWKDGEAVLFDETYIHYALNESLENRVILFCDIERPVNNPIARWVNRLFSRTIMAASATTNTEQDKLGFVNRIFKYVYQVRLVGRKLKKKIELSIIV
jgi:beta-hydroxylase